LRQRCLFVWENVGPMHGDRVAATDRLFPGQVAAIQFWPTSDTYGWKVDHHVVPVESLFPAVTPRPGFGLAWRLFRACRRRRAREIYLCHYNLWPVLLAAILLRLGGARVFCMFESKFDDYPRTLLRELGKSLFLSPYNGALVATRRSRDYIRFLGFRRRPVELGYDSLSVDRIREQSVHLPAPDGIAHGARDFLIVARLVPKKNIELALTAYAVWRAQGGGGRLLRILGSGPCEAQLRDRARELGIEEQVVFEGFVQTARVSECLGQALCLILPSIEEQFGLVVIEAMAMGVPALVSVNAGAVDTMIDNGVNGWIVDPHSPRALAFAMSRLDQDEQEWGRMAQAARDDSRRGDAAEFAAGVARLSGARLTSSAPHRPPCTR